MCLAIVGGSIVVILGGFRQQIHTTKALQAHSEARILLEQIADGFQYGETTPSDSVVVGTHAKYVVKFSDPPAVEAHGRGTITGSSESPTIELGRLKKFRITVSWEESGKGNQIGLDAWRYEPDGGAQ